MGSFVDLRGPGSGSTYAEKVLAADKKPIRIFMQDGRNDNRGQGRAGGAYSQNRDWFYQNVRLKDALTKKGYEVNYAWGIGLHGQKQGGAMLPEMLRWLWRDQVISTDPNDREERAFRAAAVRAGEPGAQSSATSSSGESAPEGLKVGR